MTVKLNTENREYIIWQFEQLNFGLLGGLKIEGLERMPCNLHDLYTIKRSDIRTIKNKDLLVGGYNFARDKK